MGTKIQINSLEALNRLIGDDESMEMEVRHSVVEAFARGFVKNIANTEAIGEVVKSIERTIDGEIAKNIRRALEIEGIEYGRGVMPKIKLGEKVLSLIQMEVRQELRDTIRQTIKAVDIEQMVEVEVDHRVKFEVNSKVRQIYKSGIDKVIQNRLNEVLKEEVGK